MVALTGVVMLSGCAAAGAGGGGGGGGDEERQTPPGVEEPAAPGVPEAGTGAVTGEAFGFMYLGDLVESDTTAGTTVALFADEAGASDWRVFLDGTPMTVDSPILTLELKHGSDELPPGTYATGEDSANLGIIFSNVEYDGSTTSAAYHASSGTSLGSFDFDTYDELTAADIEVARDGDVYTISWTLTTADGDELTGFYQGSVDSTEVSRAFVADIRSGAAFAVSEVNDGAFNAAGIALGGPQTDNTVAEIRTAFLRPDDLIPGTAYMYFNFAAEDGTETAFPTADGESTSYTIAPWGWLSDLNDGEVGIDVQAYEERYGRGVLYGAASGLTQAEFESEVMNFAHPDIGIDPYDTIPTGGTLTVSLSGGEYTVSFSEGAFDGFSETATP